MKHTKIFALVLAALLSASALCACQSPSPDPADTTPAPPAETTPTETAPAQTTSNETTTNESPYPFPEIEPMPDELRQKIEALHATEDVYNKFHGWITPYSSSGSVRYYGTYGDVVVLFTSGNIDVFTRIYIAESVFEHSSGCRLYVYYDGTFIDLSKAYEQGLISAENVAKVAEIHEQFDVWSHSRYN